VGYWQAKNDVRIQNHQEKGERVVHAWVLEREHTKEQMVWKSERVLEWETKQHRVEKKAECPRVLQGVPEREGE
jgi:hypothetical protein